MPTVCHQGADGAHKLPIPPHAVKPPLAAMCCKIRRIAEYFLSLHENGSGATDMRRAEGET